MDVQEKMESQQRLKAVVIFFCRIVSPIKAQMWFCQRIALCATAEDFLKAFAADVQW